MTSFAEVSTAAPLAPEALAKIKQALERATGKQVIAMQKPIQ